MDEPASPVFTMQEATVDDIREMAAIFLRGLSWDPLSKAFDDIMPFEAQVEIQIVAWGGLGIPKLLTEDQKLVIKGKFPDIPPDFPEGLLRCIVSFEATFGNCLERNGYDPALHFARQSTMVDTPYQRKGIGRMITRKCNGIADEAGAATYVKARPSSKPLFEQEGYRVLEEIPMNYEEFGYEGKSAVFVMKREAGGK
ncbi:hypothetical protein N431DRAFT_452880 [Stipitochalara longipes BDJ]|nr:hypothetical protein N431DRAFT_452880 [Stipitochalara longipes BDJ]